MEAEAAGVDGGERFEVVDDAAESPGDRCERTPVGRIGARLAAVHEADDALGEAAAGIELEGVGVEDGAAPALGEDLGDGGRDAGAEAAAEDDDDGDGFGGGRREIEGDVEGGRGGGVAGIVDAAEEALEFGGAAERVVVGRGDFPRDGRSVGGNAAVDFGFEKGENFGAAFLPPCVGVADRVAVLKFQDFGERAEVGFGVVVVGPVAPAGADDDVAGLAVGPIVRIADDAGGVGRASRIFFGGGEWAGLREAEQVHGATVVGGGEFGEAAAFFDLLGGERGALGEGGGAEGEGGESDGEEAGGVGHGGAGMTEGGGKRMREGRLGRLGFWQAGRSEWQEERRKSGWGW